MELNILFESEPFNNKVQFQSFESNVSEERFQAVMTSLVLLKVEFVLETYYKGQIVGQTIKVLKQSKYSIFENIKDLPIK